MQRYSLFVIVAQIRHLESYASQLTSKSYAAKQLKIYLGLTYDLIRRFTTLDCHQVPHAIRLLKSADKYARSIKHCADVEFVDLITGVISKLIDELCQAYHQTHWSERW